MSQNYDYCTDNDVLGPVFSAAGSSFKSRDIFFLASHDKFESGTSVYEYHELKDSLPYGYMFGLFSLKNASWNEIKDTLMQS